MSSPGSPRRSPNNRNTTTTATSQRELFLISLSLSNGHFKLVLQQPLLFSRTALVVVYYYEEVIDFLFVRFLLSPRARPPDDCHLSRARPSSICGGKSRSQKSGELLLLSLPAAAVVVSSSYQSIFHMPVSWFFGDPIGCNWHGGIRKRPSSIRRTTISDCCAITRSRRQRQST